jgi:GT2 family glycosyltransferase
MSVTAIVPVWNGHDFLARLLATLEAQNEPVSECLAVDNGSTDGAPELARKRGARVISMGRNMGFAAAVNRGIREAKTEWVAVLNSDVELAPDYLAKLRQAGAPFATGKILMTRDRARIDATFDLVCRGAVAWRVGNGRPDGPLFSKPRAISSPPWTAVLFHREVFARVGLLNETFESYLEDVEFGLRAAAQGISGCYVPDAIAWHRGSASLGRWHPEAVRLIARNQCYLARLHFPRRYAWPVFVAQALWGLIALRHGCGAAWLRGKWEGIRHPAPASEARGGVGGPKGTPSALEGERMIYEMQQATGFDWYWRLYFLLTQSEH